jgi:hypothetical protein
MHPRLLGRAGGLTMAALLVMTAAAQAETVTPDGDAVTAGDQATVDLGTVLPGQDRPVTVSFRLDCSGTSHVDPGQSVRLTPGSRTIPAGGSFSVGSVTLTPGAGWPADGEACPDGLAGIVGTLHMVITAPPDPGTNLKYVFSWNRSLAPTTADDSGVLGGTNPTLTFLLDVVDNTPPTLTVPDDSTVEGDTTGGALASYAVAASDAEDAVAPTPACSPAVGAVLPLGANTIACSVTDGGGLETTGSFRITVVDTTAPSLAGLPADRTIVTNDPAGATLTYAAPSATDVVDPAPTVACVPVSGSLLPVGSTTVTCTATDASGNASSGSFHVDVAYVAPITWTAVWGEPVATSGDTFSANAGRSIPIKVETFANGVEQVAGQAVLTVTACGGADVMSLELVRDAGRWTGKLDTSRLPASGCYVATVRLDGNAAGSFRIDLRGTVSASAASSSPKGNGRH